MTSGVRAERLADWGAGGLGEPVWNRLLARSGTNVPFLSWQFQTTWWRTLGHGALHLLGVRDGTGEWVGALPLFAADGRTGRTLQMVGGAEVADYLDVLAPPERAADVWPALLSAIADTGLPVDLHPVPATSPTIEVLPGLARGIGIDCRVERLDRCPVIDLASSWDAYLAGLPGKDRHELRRKLRRAEAHRPRLEVARTAAGVSALLDSFLALHRKSRVGKARFMDERMEGFFRAMGAAMAEADEAAVWLLWLEEQPVASMFCLEHDGTVGLYNSGFDPAARVLSPGVVLIARTIEDAIARGFRRYDLLRGEEPYKYGFGAVPFDVMRVWLGRDSDPIEAAG